MADPLNSAQTGRRSGAILALLLSINLLNYVDRYVLAAVAEPVKKDLFAKDLLTADAPYVDFWMGLLPSAFLLSYMIASPLFGWLADRVNRWKIIALGVIVWSLASGASGLATSFGMLLATRVFVGIGEAAYGPAAPTVLADLYPIERRGRILALLYLAIPVGSALGYVLGGLIGGMWGWRWAFFFSLPPGLLLGFVCLRLPDTRARIRTSRPSPLLEKSVTRTDYWQLARTPSYVLNSLGMAMMTFALGAVAYWLPSYVYAFRHKDLPASQSPSLERVNLICGIITVVAGITATLFGGWLGDKLRARFSGSYFSVSGVGMLLGTPLFLCVLEVPFPWAWGLVFLTEFCLLLNTGPANTILANVTRPNVRAMGFAINIFVIHILGDAISPPLVGWITGLAGGNMNVGFAAVSVAMLASGLFWMAGAPFLARDTQAIAEETAA